MKKIFLALGLLLVVGGGCVSVGKLGGEKTVEGDWHVAFDLPSDWVMVVPYGRPDTEVVVPSQAIDRSLSEVYIQTTEKAVVIGGIAPEDEVSTDSYVLLGQDHSLIHVRRLDSSRLLPEGAEDLGNRFFKIKQCEEGEDCQIDGRHDYDYYLETDEAKYMFTSFGERIDDMEKIILSATVVTETDEVNE